MKQKRNFLLMAFVVLFTFNSMEAQVIKTGNNIKGPVMNLPETTYDFGSVMVKSEISKEFKFINDGTEPLIIIQIKNSKQCAVVDYPQKGIKPGNHGKIIVECKLNSVASEDELIAIKTNSVNGLDKEKIGIFQLRIKGIVKTK